MLTAIIKMQNLMNDTRDLVQDRRGATAIEYGLIAGLIAVIIIAGVTLIGDNLLLKFNAIGGALG